MNWLRHNWGWPVAGIVLALVVFQNEIWDAIQSVANPEDKEAVCQEALDSFLDENGGWYGEEGNSGPYVARGRLEVLQVKDVDCEGTVAWEQVHIEVCRVIRQKDDPYEPEWSRLSSDDVRYLLDQEGCT